MTVLFYTFFKTINSQKNKQESMKKISTLAVALITMGSLAMPAWADVVPTSTLPSGYYKIKSATTQVDIRPNINLFSDYFL